MTNMELMVRIVSKPANLLGDGDSSQFIVSSRPLTGDSVDDAELAFFEVVKPRPYVGINEQFAAAVQRTTLRVLKRSNEKTGDDGSPESSVGEVQQPDASVDAPRKGRGAGVQLSRCSPRGNRNDSDGPPRKLSEKEIFVQAMDGRDDE